LATGDEGERWLSRVIEIADAPAPNAARARESASFSVDALLLLIR
jgi:hypothetical protein